MFVSQYNSVQDTNCNNFFPDARENCVRDVFIGCSNCVQFFRNSPLSARLQEECGNFYILGDSTYPCLRNLLVPHKNYENLTTVETNFNKKLSHCRILTELTFGILKLKFRQLYHLKLHKIELIYHFI